MRQVYSILPKWVMVKCIILFCIPWGSWYNALYQTVTEGYVKMHFLCCYSVLVPVGNGKMHVAILNVLVMVKCIIIFCTCGSW
jgi:hypothetical protein